MRGSGRTSLAALLALAPMAGSAQTTIYESRDKAGPVFSDRPAAGASAVQVQPANAVAMPVPKAPAPQASAPAAPSYRSIGIVSLAHGSTVHINTGAFEFSVRSAPALRPGDRYRIALDGQLLPTGFRGPSLSVTEGDWRRAARSEGNEHTLQVSIFDAQGAMLIASEPIGFYVQRAAVGGARK